MTGFGGTGAALVDCPDIDKILFTGSPQIGKLVMEGASKVVVCLNSFHFYSSKSFSFSFLTPAPLALKTSCFGTWRKRPDGDTRRC